MLKFNLIENAQDSLEHAIEHLTCKSELTAWDYKHVIRDLSHVAELLFKEKLRTIHPAFVFSNIDKYPSSSANTVSTIDAISRLERIGEVEFDKSDVSALKIIRNTRNDIEHYEFNFNESESRIIIGNVLVFIFRFSLDELGLDWADRRINDPKWMKLNEYASFFEAQKRYLLDTLMFSGLLTASCPICQNDLFDTEAEVCILCGHREKVYQCSRCNADYFQGEVDNQEVGLCPKCEWDEGFAAANFEKY
jgi:hypothetical protein